MKTNVETIEDFYKQKFNWMPDNIRNEIGHFNVFELEPFVGTTPKPIPYKRRDFFKITLVIGNSRVYFADKVVEVEKQALAFSNPQVLYKWEHVDHVRSGFFCVFNEHFFHHYGAPNEYSVFQPGGTHVFELTDEQLSKVTAIYERMFEEINSGYVHKYDVLRTLVFELLHFAMKMQPSSKEEKHLVNAAQRICTLFLELLERQFPIDDSHQKINFRSPAEFAGQLNIPVNHLNRAVKSITDKTTSQLIAERILQEAKILLRHSSWNVSEIADALGFNEVNYFNQFFKKHAQVSPAGFRKV